MPRLTKTKARSIIMHALSKFCGKQADRSELKGGDQFDVDLAISGTIGNQKVEDNCRGSLSVGHDSTRNASNGIAPAKLVAFLLHADPAKTDKLTDQLRKLAANGKIGDKVTKEQESHAASVISLFNQTTSTTAKGTVSFKAAKAAA